MYRASTEEITGSLGYVYSVSGADHDMELLSAVLTEAGRFCDDRVSAVCGSDSHAVFSDRTVTMPDGWTDLYSEWCSGGWNGLSAPESHGGQALPASVSAATFEMWNGASLSFGIGPALTLGGIEALCVHGGDLCDTYLEALVSGRWMATMNLTESNAGSDLRDIRTRSEPDGNGVGYRITGSKIFITFGEHNLTENIIHLVLARSPDSDGLSLFLVPKFLVNDDGSLGERNNVFCTGMEEKLGLHGSPTCSMSFENALGFLVGEIDRGLACMFTMMNNARLMVAVQGVSVADAATQRACAYAMERIQGRIDGEQVPIIRHPDVARTLLLMRCLTDMSRLVVYRCASALDDSASGSPDLCSLLTPVSKAFATDIGVEVSSLGIQVHGGMGYIEETGAARLFRDSRIAPIYEGTNGIQAIDLAVRKLSLGGGSVVSDFLGELRGLVNRIDNPDISARLTSSLDDLESCTELLRTSPRESVLWVATPYLRLFGLVTGGCYLCHKNLCFDSSSVSPDSLDPTKNLDLVSRFCVHDIMSESASLRVRIESGLSFAP